jgi:UDP-N-acetylglucosamine 2-epimerase (non-hydrolysing)
VRVICVAGARPNFMKVKPVLEVLEARRVEVVLVHTGQHYDASMSDVFFEDLGLRKPDWHLGVGPGSHAAQTGKVMMEFEPLVERLSPDVVIVVGDVNSTLACALVAAKAGPLLAHVEAGLRSRDWTMPEEINRVVTDRVSDLLFAPSADAVTNLEAEGCRRDQIQLVGNVMVDTLMANLERARQRPALARFGVEAGGYGLVTLHRPANVDDPSELRPLLGALGEIAREVPLIFPVHPRAAARLEALGAPRGVTVTPPLRYLDFLALEAGARLVLTDSGGVQEETTFLRVPCFTLRDRTERPITVSRGTNRVLGLDVERVVDVPQLLEETALPLAAPDGWDGHAAQRIADLFISALASDDAARACAVSAAR